MAALSLARTKRPVPPPRGLLPYRPEPAGAHRHGPHATADAATPGHSPPWHGEDAPAAAPRPDLPDDRFERQADRLADRVVETRPTVRRPPAGATPPVVRQVLQSPGEPLPAATRRLMEERFGPGSDFSAVRLHADALAAASAREVQAHAYTVGRHVVFGAGRLAPGAAAGQRLLAHELAHVVQQERGGAAVPSAGGGPLEGAAESAAAAFATGATPIHVAGASAPGLARQPAPPVSLSQPPDPMVMSDDELRTTLKEIHRWQAGQTSSTPEFLQVEQIQELLQDELNHRNRQRAMPKEPVEKPGRGKKRRRPPVDPTAQLPAPRSATSSFDIAALSADEQADELQRIDEWLALASPADSRRKTVEAVQAATARRLESTEAAPMFERHTLRISSVKRSQVVTTELSGLNRYQAIDALRLALKTGRYESEEASDNLDVLYEYRNSMPTRSRISGFLGGASDPGDLVDLWSRGSTLLYQAEDALDAGDFTRAAELHRQALEHSVRVVRGVHDYFGDTISGAERAVTGLKVVKTGSAVAVTIGTGGTTGLVVGGAYAGAQNLAQQASEIHFDLRDKIDWGDVAFDTVVGGLSGYLGGKLGNMVVAKLMGRAAFASLGRKAVAYAVGDYIAGRSGSTIHLTARTAYDLARGRDVTWEQFLDQLADQITDPRQAAEDVILGHASRYLAKTIDRPRTTADEPAPQPQPAPSPGPAQNPTQAAQNYAARFNGRLVNDAGLEGIFERTRTQPTLSVDRRAAAAELRQIDQILTNGYDGRTVTRVRVLPPTNRQRTPDLVLEFADGSTSRVEIRTFTAAPKGHSPPHEPLATATQSRSQALTQADLESAIFAKARSTSTRPSQLDVPLTGVAAGGRISIVSNHAPVSLAAADAAMASLTPRLGPHVHSVAITAPSGTGAGRVTIVYRRQGQGFVR